MKTWCKDGVVVRIIGIVKNDWYSKIMAFSRSQMNKTKIGLMLVMCGAVTLFVQADTMPFLQRLKSAKTQEGFNRWILIMSVAQLESHYKEAVHGPFLQGLPGKEPPLFLALRHKKWDVLEWLLHKGAKPQKGEGPFGEGPFDNDRFLEQLVMTDVARFPLVNDEDHIKALVDPLAPIKKHFVDLLLQKGMITYQSFPNGDSDYGSYLRYFVGEKTIEKLCEAVYIYAS
jgi:hypothetical protein